MTQLNRSLGLGQCIFYGVGSILGAGIYTLIGKVAGLSGNLTWLAFLIASVCALFTAFSYAELSSMYPKAGGEYVYANNAFGKKMAVGLGILISFSGMVSAATVAVGFAGYLETLVGLKTLIGSLGILVLIFIVNASGIKQSSIVNIIFTLIEAGGLVFVIVACLSSIGKVNFTEMPEGNINNLLAASSLAFFAFQGFEEIVKLAQETKQPQKNIPKALFIATGIVIVFYTAIALCVVSAMPYQELGKSDSPLADVVAKNYGKAGIIAISAIALFATSNTILSNMLGSSRILLNMGQEAKWLKPLSYVSPKFRTPLLALLFVLLVSVSFALIGKIETIARITTIFVFITFIVVNFCVIALRFSHTSEKRPYKIPFNFGKIPATPVLAIILTLVLLAYSIYELAK